MTDGSLSAAMVVKVDFATYSFFYLQAVCEATSLRLRKLAQFGRALGLGPRGRWFESSVSD